MEGFRISVEPRDGSIVVAILGGLDIITSPRLDECLTQARSKHSRIVLDLAGVDFMDTSCLAVIVGHWKKLEAAGGTLALAGARYRYTKTLWITGLADRLPMFDNVEQAVSACQPAASSSRRAGARSARGGREPAGTQSAGRRPVSRPGRGGPAGDATGS